ADTVALPSFPTRRSSDLDGGGYQRASLMEEARGDQRIAAVVARTGHHQDALVADPTDERLCETGNLPAGDLHQLQRLDAEFVARSEEHTPELQSLAYLVC